jgi:hypothetical protein
MFPAHRSKHIKYRLPASVGILLAVCSCGGSNVTPGDRDYPKRNPEPKRFLSLHGTIDSSLGIKFGIGWSAGNPDCRYALSVMEGAYAQFSAGENLDYKVENSAFSLLVPIDGVLPGRCGWKFSGMGITAENSGMSIVQTNSYPLKAGQSPNGIVRLHCERVMRKLEPKVPALFCAPDGPEDRSQSVLGGVLWWQPETTELEVHIRRGACRPSSAADCLDNP